MHFRQANDITIHCLTAKGEPYTDKVSLECKLVPESPLGLATPIIPKPYPDTQTSSLGASKFGTTGGTTSQPIVKFDTGGLFGNVPWRSVVGIDSRFGGVASQPNLLGVRQPLCGAGLADSCPPVPPLTCGGVGSEPNPRIKDISKFRSGQGKFLIPYQPTGNPGRQQLYITVCGQHIRGSPFRVEVIVETEIVNRRVIRKQSRRKT